MTKDIDAAQRPAVVASADIILWTPEADEFCKRLAAAVIASVPDAASPAFKPYRHDGTMVDLCWMVGDERILTIGWTPAGKTDLNADLTAQRGVIEIGVFDTVDALLLSQRVIDIVQDARESGRQSKIAT